MLLLVEVGSARSLYTPVSIVTTTPRHWSAQDDFTQNKARHLAIYSPARYFEHHRYFTARVYVRTRFVHFPTSARPLVSLRPRALAVIMPRCIGQPGVANGSYFQCRAIEFTRGSDYYFQADTASFGTGRLDAHDASYSAHRLFADKKYCFLADDEGAKYVTDARHYASLDFRETGDDGRRPRHAYRCCRTMSLLAHHDI